MAEITAESPEDAGAIGAVHRESFPTGDEAVLVAQRRASDSFDPSLSLVVRTDGAVAGHALLSPVGVDGEWEGLVLAPVSVRPSCQGEGLGSELVRAAVKRARHGGWDAVFLHGSPEFYPRFGFRPAGELGFENPFETPPDEFMIAVLTERPSPGGRLTYPPAFDGL